jgi:hypothetical protein
MRAIGNAYKILVGEPEWQRPLVKPKRKWEYNIKMDLEEIGCEDTEWIYLAGYNKYGVIFRVP